MQNLKWGDEYRSTQVCVDGYAEGVLRGRFYHPARPEGLAFESLTQFLLQMEEMLHELDRPQANTAARHFPTGGEHRTISVPAGKAGKGGLATFRLRVLFRQHASWQGEVTWLEEGVSQRFRSVLELVHLMDSALGRDRPEGGTKTQGT